MNFASANSNLLLWFKVFWLNLCRLAELKLEKQKMSRQLRDNDEEQEIMRQKVETLQQDLRKLEKAKREVRIKYLFIHTERDICCILYYVTVSR